MKIILADNTIDLGENRHIAFNDPPAVFDSDAAFIKVELDKDSSSLLNQ